MKPLISQFNAQAADVAQASQDRQNGACGFHATLHSQEFSQFLPFSNHGVRRPHRLTKRRFLK